MLVLCHYCGRGLFVVDFDSNALLISAVCAHCGSTSQADFSEEPSEDEPEDDLPGQYL